MEVNLKISLPWFLLVSISCLSTEEVLSWSQTRQYGPAKNYEGSSDSVDVEYHMGPVLSSSPTNLYIIWYGRWDPLHRSTITDFISSLSSAAAPSPSVSSWWRTVRLYADQTGSNVTGTLSLSGEFHDSGCSQGSYLTRLAMQSVIRNAVSARRGALPLDYRGGLYLILTAGDVGVQDFCREVCGFHYFTFPSVVGVTVPYAWVGYSGRQCPGMCAYPFARPSYYPGRGKAMGAPNGDAGVDGMISVIGHELAEVSSNPLVNAWYAGEDPTAPTEIADLCVGIYGSGGGGGYVGEVYRDSWGNGYNVKGVKGRRFLVQWVWDPARRRCFGPNALD